MSNKKSPPKPPAENDAPAAENQELQELQARIDALADKEQELVDLQAKIDALEASNQALTQTAEALQASSAALESENEQLKEQAETLQASSDSQKGPDKIEGQFKCTITRGGKNKKVTISFKDGSRFTRYHGGHLVPTKQLLLAANEEDYSSPEHPGLEHEEAKKWLTKLAQLDYGQLIIN